MSLAAELSGLQGGAAERQAALASLQEQLTCPICVEVFNKPVVILPCQHNLCRKCANELYQPSLFQARTTMMVNSGRFRCPSCRHEVVLDRHGVYGLQRNLLVENIIDVYKQEVSSCRCPDHEAEKVNIYCLTCQVPTCSLCKVFGAHQTCQVAPLADVYQRRKDELSEGIDAVGTFNNKVQSVIDELEETCRSIEDAGRTRKQTVSDKFSRMFSILQERQKAMTQQISEEQDEKTGRVMALARCYGDQVEANRKLVESARSSMEEADLAVFIQNSGELITKVRTASGSLELQVLEPGYENLRRYRLNSRRQEEALRGVGFRGPDGADGQRSLKFVPEPERPKHPLVQDLPEADRRPETPPRSSLAGPPPPRTTPPEEEAEQTPVAPPPPPPPREATEADGPDSDHVTSVKEEEEEEEEQEEEEQQEEQEQQEQQEEEQEQQQEGGGCAVKEEVCEDEDGLSTQQAVALIFYLLAFLVLLQRFWSYIGCFVCT